MATLRRKMLERPERAALVLLVRRGTRRWPEYVAHLQDHGSLQPLLGQELGLLASAELEALEAELAEWETRGFRLATVCDRDYPDNLHTVHDRPPFVFIEGTLTEADRRAIALIGSRRATAAGLNAAACFARSLVEHGFTVISGLATGIDTASHRAALDAGGRTVGVIGTGLAHSYPPQNRGLQARIGRECAVVSQFWPEDQPAKRSFPLRNAVMSGLALATLVVEASSTSGARAQTRLALAHGRPVMLAEALLEQPWAKELAGQRGVHVISSPAALISVAEELAGLSSQRDANRPRAECSV